MRNNEQMPRGRQTFGITTPLPPPVRDKDLAPPPTPEEKRAANAGELAPRGLTKKVLNLAKNHPVLTAGATLAAIAGGFAAVEAYQGNIPGIHRSVDQGSNSNPSQIRFGDKPPLRQPDNLSQTGSLELPTITEYHDQHFIPRITFRLKEKDSIPNSTDTSIRYPYTSIEGYVIKKEINPDKSVMIALEIPGKNGFFTSSDINKAPTSLDELKDDGNEGRLSSAIIWVKLVDWSNFSLPFAFAASWNNNFASTQSGKITWQPEEVLKYIRTGDPLHASGATQISSWAEAKLVENYQTKRNTLTFDEARKQYSDIAEANALTLKRLIDDAKTGNVSLKEQLYEKKYVFEVSSLNFVPRTQQ